MPTTSVEPASDALNKSLQRQMWNRGWNVRHYVLPILLITASFAASVSSVHGYWFYAPRLNRTIPSLADLQTKSDAGGGAATYDLARRYYLGWGVPKDSKHFIALLKLSSDQGNSKGAVQYAQMTGVVGDKYLEIVQSAVAAEEPTAIYQEAYLYEQGKSVPQDLAKSDQLYRQAAKLFETEMNKGDLDAVVYLSNQYWLGQGVPADHAKSHELLDLVLNSVDKGEAEELLEIGIMRMGDREFNGHKSEEMDDHEYAIKLLSKAAELGSAVAQFNLSCIYDKGTVVPKDATKATAYLNDFIAHADADELFQAAQNYSHSYPSDVMFLSPIRNVDISLNLYNLAIKAGSAQAMVELAKKLDWFPDAETGKRPFKQDEGFSSDPARALALYQSAASRGDPSAMVALGNKYIIGYGVAKAPAIAVPYFQDAWALGYAPAAGGLSECYLKGEGVPKDLGKAFELAKAAAVIDKGFTAGDDASKLFYGLEVDKNLDQAILFAQLGVNSGDAESQKILKEAQTAKSAPPIYQPRQAPVSNEASTEPPNQAPPVRIPTGNGVADVKLTGSGELTVQNPSKLDSIIKVIDNTTNKRAFIFSVQANDKFTITGIPDGSYRIVCGFGYDWNTATEVFKKDSSFIAIDSPFVYQTSKHTESRADGDYDVTDYSKQTLILNSYNGNLTRRDITPEEFYKY
jgi:TPR repeat protein